MFDLDMMQISFILVMTRNAVNIVFASTDYLFLWSLKIQVSGA